jgi:imidazolonepropionase-like amidohydrolase
MMAERKVYYVPTMSGIYNVAEREATNGNNELADLIRNVVGFPQKESVTMAYKHGLLIGTGSDTLGSVFQELKMFTGCGMSNTEALKCATSNAAKILHLENQIGFIKEGYTADLVLLNGNPLENLENLRRIEMVIAGGSIVNNEWMCNLSL